MEIAATLAADLALFTAAAYDPAADPTSEVADMVLVLAADVRLAVRSFVGLTVTVTIAGHAGEAADRVVLRFTLLDDYVDPSDIETSLRLPEPTHDAAPNRPSIAAVLYAATPGAFVDMAADFSFLTGRELAAGDIDQHLALAGEADITGVLRAETAIHEAIGVLIARGHTRERAYTELDALADAAHTHRATEASRILTALAWKGTDVATLEASGVDLT